MRKCAIVTGTLALICRVNTQIPSNEIDNNIIKRRIKDAKIIRRRITNANTFGSDKSLYVESSCIDKNTTLCARIKIRNRKYCEKFFIAAICPKTCGVCCVDDKNYTFPQEGGYESLKKCDYIKTDQMRKKYCKGKTNKKCALSCMKRCLTPQTTRLLITTENLILPPSEASVPSLPEAFKEICPNGKTSFLIKLQTDSYPSETTWYLNRVTQSERLIKATQSKRFIRGGPYTSPNNPHIESYCVDKNECYKFTILDSSSNGLCCYDGDVKAHYQVYLGRNLVQEGGNFSSSETSPSFGTCSLSNMPSVIPTKSSAPTAKNPTFSPTGSSEPTSIHGCINGQSALQIVLKTDYYPYETKWNIANNFGAVVKEGIYSDEYTAHNESYCLDTNQCYIFTIFDSFDDGICCDSGDGFYRVYYGGYLVQEGGSFNTSEFSPSFGSCSSSIFPSVSNVPSIYPTISHPTTKHPTLKPTAQLSGSPTNKPISLPSTDVPTPNTGGSDSPTDSPTSPPLSFINFSEFRTLEGHTSFVNSITFNSDGSRLASGSDSKDKTVKIWDVDKYELVQTLEGHNSSIISVAFSPNGSKLASASHDETIRIWDMDNGGSHLHTIEGYHSGSVAFSSVGSKLAFGSTDSTVNVWNTANDSLFSTFRGHTKTILSVAFTPDGSKLASASLDSTIRIWDMNNHSHIQTLQGHTNYVNSIAFSPNGKTLASGSFDRTIKLWNIHTGKNYTLTGITSAVKGVAFSPDGKQLGAGLVDGTIMLWDMGTFKLLQTLKGHRKHVNDIAYSPTNSRDRYQLASGSDDETIIIWDSMCPAGTYINANEPDCQLCPKGAYQNNATFSRSCRLCPAGTYQNKTGGIECISCNRGSFQPLEGKASCEKCRAGGYCPFDGTSNTCSGGFTPCPAGTFNEKIGGSNNSSCIPCPNGTFSDKEGTIQCSQCPYRLDSDLKSNVCSFCAQDFYLSNKTVDTIELIEKKDELCLPCPKNVKCQKNQTIETMRGDPGFWRDSQNTKEFYKCKSKELCLGSKCAEGYRGVLCEICVEEDQYFEDKECIDCPSYLQFGIVFGVTTSIAMYFVIFYDGACSSSRFKHYLDKVVTILTRISIQAKLKIIISFFQVVVTFEPIYGIRMHSKFEPYFGFFKKFNFGLVELFGIPGSCIGDMRDRLLINGTWPYIFVLVLVSGKLVHTILVRMQFIHREFSTKFWRRCLQVIIVIFYFALPSVSRSIFDAKICESFISNDAQDLTSSYLVSDWRLSCEDKETNTEYQGLLSIFWILFFVWPIAVPLLFLGLLLSVRKSVRSNRMTPLAEACRFLWSDYDKSVMFWDFLDVSRKIILTGLVIFIDPNEGSEKILRLLLAIIVCIIYTTILALARPYGRKDDLYLSVISNLFLACCFVVGIAIHECKEDNDVEGENKICDSIFGLSMNSYKATLVAFFLTAVMLFISIAMIIVLFCNEINAPTIHLVSTNSSPRMEMPADCKFHVFFSHIWKTGQNKTHKIVAMLRLYLPTIKIWLDVDDLEDISKLEKAVKDSACFVLLYTKGYFKSKNCCREVNAAILKRKPIIVIYQKDEDVYDDIYEMQDECRQFLPAVPTFDAVNYIFANDPILWLNTNKLFTIETVKLIVGKVLENLPYYQMNPALLDKGLKIGCELGPVGVISPLQILICSSNTGAEEITLKLIDESMGEVSMCAVDPSTTQLQEIGKKSMMLLYLNRHTFDDPDNQICETVKLILSAGIQIVLVHEKDTIKGGCPFCDIISETPNELKADPIKLYENNMAIDLYSVEEYELVSLRLILDKMGAIPVSAKFFLKYSSTRLLYLRSSMRFRVNENDDNI